MQLASCLFLIYKHKFNKSLNAKESKIQSFRGKVLKTASVPINTPQQKQKDEGELHRMLQFQYSKILQTCEDILMLNAPRNKNIQFNQKYEF